MKFFDEQGNQIQYQQWLKIYAPYYFLDGPTLDNRITRQRQTSQFVEDQVVAVLKQTTQLSKDDLILAMAWKIGEIDHPGSEAAKKVEYLHNWPTALKDRYGHDFSVSIPNLAANLPTILTHIAQGNPQYVFNLDPKPQGFGFVYILAVLFFVTHGRFPIYDRYAHIAALAIDQGLSPESNMKRRSVQKWSDFQQYINLLLPISKACPQQFGDPSMFVSRPVDRALWVYGHFFKTKRSRASTTRSSGIPSPGPVISDSDGVLIGRIHNLGQNTTDGWRRREIIIKQGNNGSPKVRDRINLVDSSGAMYGDLPFIKGSGQGYVCLGKPGALKPWFTRNYPLDETRAENVYFEPTEHPNEYQIYSELEWKARGTRIQPYRNRTTS